MKDAVASPPAETHLASLARLFQESGVDGYDLAEIKELCTNLVQESNERIAEAHKRACAEQGNTQAGHWVVLCRQHSGATPRAPSPATPGEPQAAGVRALHADGRLETPYEPATLPLVRSFPGARWNAEGKFWTVSTAVQDRPRVLELARQLGLAIAPELDRAVTELNPRVAEASARATAAGLYPYQVRGVEFLAVRDRALLADDMGLGKTAQTLLALDAERGTIVVCPASLKYVWRDEAARWRPDLTVAVLAGRGSFRLPVAGEIVVINFDILPTEEDVAALTNLTECALVVDEAHKVKSYKAARSKRVAASAGIRVRSN